MGTKFGLERLARYYRVWDRIMGDPKKHAIVIRYEDFHRDAFKEYKRLLKWINKMSSEVRRAEDHMFDVTDDLVRESVEYASFDHMHKMEEDKTYGNWAALKPTNPENPEQWKTRKGKVGGYSDYMTDEEIEWATDIMRHHQGNIMNPYLAAPVLKSRAHERVDKPKEPDKRPECPNCGRKLDDVTFQNQKKKADGRKYNCHCPKCDSRWLHEQKPGR